MKLKPLKRIGFTLKPMHTGEGKIQIKYMIKNFKNAGQPRQNFFAFILYEKCQPIKVNI
jgi:hypothetical protein